MIEDIYKGEWVGGFCFGVGYISVLWVQSGKFIIDVVIGFQCQFCFIVFFQYIGYCVIDGV